MEGGVFRGVRARWLQKKIQLSSIEWRVETTACQDMSLGGEEENWVEFWRRQSKVIEKKWQERN
jgi:hypothetical protein